MDISPPIVNNKISKMVRTPESKSCLGKIYKMMVVLLLIVLFLHPGKAEEDSILSSATVPTIMYFNNTPDANVFLHGSFKSAIRTQDTPSSLDNIKVDLNLP